jgi:hypothetical protein
LNIGHGKPSKSGAGDWGTSSSNPTNLSGGSVIPTSHNIGGRGASGTQTRNANNTRTPSTTQKPLIPVPHLSHDFSPTFYPWLTSHSSFYP